MTAKDQLFADFYSHFEKGQYNYCWRWTGPWNADNIPVYYLGKRPELAARWIYFFFNGRKPNRMQKLLLKCCNDQCVNPLHMACFDPTLLRLLNEQVEKEYADKYWNCLTDNEKEYNKLLIQDLQTNYTNEWPLATAVKL